MVTGNEYIFENIDEALKYVLEMEQRQLKADDKRKDPPLVFRYIPNLSSMPFSNKMAIELAKQALVPVNSLDYPQSAWFNNAATDNFSRAFVFGLIIQI